MAGIEIAREFAPALIGAITGKGGERAAEAVLETAAKVAGVDADNYSNPADYVGDVKDHIRRHPELAVELRSRLLEHVEIMARLDNEDRASARGRDVALRQVGQRNWRADVLAYAVVALFAYVVHALISNSVPEDVGRILFFMLGTLGTLVTQVYSFEFGSSQGSKAKDLKAWGGPS